MLYPLSYEGLGCKNAGGSSISVDAEAGRVPSSPRYGAGTFGGARVVGQARPAW